MEKYAWHGRIVSGKKEEYKRRHDSLWPEMAEVLRKAGIVNYTIWNVGDELFGYYECKYGIAHAVKVQNKSSVVARWDEYMKDILIMDESGEDSAQPQLRLMFSFE